MKALAKKILHLLWIVNGFLGFKSYWSDTRHVTVLITYFNPVRMKHINHQIRNLLKCDFVEKVIISNHNPDINIEALINVTSDRVVVRNQQIRRGCGYRWWVANDFSPEFLIVADDDLLLFPRQIKKLFAALIHEPQMPHGFAGMIQQSDYALEYHQKENRIVDYLCEIYAITGEQLKQYTKLSREIIKDETLKNMVEFSADFIITSRTGSQKPHIHHTSHILRCPSFNQTGVAVHREQVFLESVRGVVLALDKIV